MRKIIAILGATLCVAVGAFSQVFSDTTTLVTENQRGDLFQVSPWMGVSFRIGVDPGMTVMDALSISIHPQGGESGVPDFTISIKLAEGQPLGVGVLYTDTGRWWEYVDAKIWHPAFGVSYGETFDAEGTFEIKEVGFGEDGKPTSLALDYFQKNPLEEDKWVRGYVRVNSSYPITFGGGGGAIPEPGEYALAFGLGLGGFAAYHRRRQRAAQVVAT